MIAGARSGVKGGVCGGDGVRAGGGRAPPLRSGSGCARSRARYNCAQLRRAPCAGMHDTACASLLRVLGPAGAHPSRDGGPATTNGNGRRFAGAPPRPSPASCAGENPCATADCHSERGAARSRPGHSPVAPTEESAPPGLEPCRMRPTPPQRCLPEGLPRRPPPAHRPARARRIFFARAPADRRGSVHRTLPAPKPPPGVFGGGGRVLRARWGRTAPSTRTGLSSTREPRPAHAAGYACACFTSRSNAARWWGLSLGGAPMKIALCAAFSGRWRTSASAGTGRA